jgi:hypothetical protein
MPKHFTAAIQGKFKCAVKYFKKRKFENKKRNNPRKKA